VDNFCRRFRTVITRMRAMKRWGAVGSTSALQSELTPALAVPEASRGWLLRTGAFVFLAILCAQLWWPRSLTAEPPKGTPRSQTSRQREVPGQVREGIHRTEFQDEARANVGLQRVAQANPKQPHGPAPALIPGIPDLNVNQFVSPQGLSSSLNVWLAVTVLSLAPAILMMSTCFVRFIVVLSLLRQALGTPNLPPNQVLMGLSLLLTLLVMAPVWNESYQQGIRPYTETEVGGARPPFPVVFDNTVRPLRRFMSQQIDKAHNPDAVWMFIEYQRPAPDSPRLKTGVSRKLMTTSHSPFYCQPIC
jgi:flagellar biosynthesis protein FliP